LFSDPGILTVGTFCFQTPASSQLAHFVFRPRHPHSWHILHRMLGGPQDQPQRFRREKNSCLCNERNPFPQANHCSYWANPGLNSERFPVEFRIAHVWSWVIIDVVKHLGALGHVRCECSCPGPRGCQGRGCKSDITLRQIAAWHATQSSLNLMVFLIINLFSVAGYCEHGMK